MSIQDRLLKMIPALDYGLETFLSLLEVCETAAVPTAAVPMGGRPRLLINPAFVEAHCQEDHHLLALVLHELHHIILGHTRLFKRCDKLHNIAFDAVVNAMITGRSEDGSMGDLFVNLYSPNKLPELLLRPPVGYPGPPEFPEGLAHSWQVLVHNLYYCKRGTFFEVYEALIAALIPVMEVCLLGDHAGEDERGVEACDGPIFDIVREIVGRWPQPPNPRIGRSLDYVLRTEHVGIDKSTDCEVLKQALLAAAKSGWEEAGKRTVAPTAIQSAISTRDRRAFALRAAGGVPLLYAASLPDRERPNGVAPVQVIVDVSGSVQPWHQELLSAIHLLRDLVDPAIFQFSTRVVPCTPDDIAAGRIMTTQGTCGESLVAHIVETKPASVVVLTDGYVGAIPHDLSEAAAEIPIIVVLTPGGFRRDLEPITNEFYPMKESI